MRNKIFFGWVVVACTFVLLTIAFGALYSFSAFVAPLRDEFAINQRDVSLVFALAVFLYFMVGTGSGVLTDRYGPRPVILTGVIMLTLGLVLASQAETLWQLYLFFGGFAGVGIGFIYVPSVGAVQPWFLAKRGMASGFAVAGIGAGTLAAPLMAHALIDWAGWRWTYIIFAIIVLLLGLLTAAVIDNNPAKRGLAPDGAALASDQGQASGVIAGMSLRQAIRTRPFILMYLAMIIASLALFVPFVHLVTYARDHGHSSDDAILIVSMIGLGSLLGRFLVGGAADRLGRRWAFMLAYVGLLLASVIWYFSSSFWPLVAFTVLFGVSYGGFVALAPAICADYFGGKAISAIIGALYSSVGIASLVGSPLAGWIYDRTGDYQLVIAICIGCFLLAALLCSALPRIETFRQRAAW